MSASNIPWLQVATVCALFCVICTCVKDLEKLRKVSSMCIHVRVSVKELKRARDDGRCRRGRSLEFLASKTWWSEEPMDRFICIAKEEEFNKAGGKVDAHLNAVAPRKIGCVKVGKCSSCRSLNLKFEAFRSKYSHASCSQAIAILAVANRIIRLRVSVANH